MVYVQLVFLCQKRFLNGRLNFFWTAYHHYSDTYWLYRHYWLTAVWIIFRMKKANCRDCLSSSRPSIASSWNLFNRKPIITGRWPCRKFLEQSLSRASKYFYIVWQLTILSFLGLHWMNTLVLQKSNQNVHGRQQ